MGLNYNNSKKSKSLFFFMCFFLLGIIALGVVSAEITFSQVKPVYAVGEDFSNEIKLTTPSPGYLDVDLICAEVQENLYHNVPETNAVTIKRKLIPAYIGNLSGDCYLSASYGSESQISAVFRISKEIKITLETVQKDFDVGTQVKIKGTALKENNLLVGQIQTGVVEASINENIKTTDIVKAGQFSFNLSIPDELIKGAYNILIKVSEKDTEGNVIANGELIYEINVIQKPGKISIALEQATLTPGDDLRLIPFLYDKAGEEMENNLLLQIKDSQGLVLQEGIIEANKDFILPISTQTPAGTLSIVAQKDSLSNQKTIEVTELRKVLGEMRNQTLHLVNIGNVPYTKIIEIKIGNETVLKEITVGVNETRDYDLYAPDGIYDVEVKDEEQVIMGSYRVPMTGNAISVEEAQVRINNFFNQYPIVWIFILIVLAALFFTTYKKYEKTRFLDAYREKRKFRSFKDKGGIRLVLPSKSSNSYEKQEGQDKKSEEKVKEEPKEYRKIKNEDKVSITGEIREAEQAGVLHGTKQTCSVIAIKFRNGLPKADGKSNLMSALEVAYKNKAVSYFSGDFALVIFAPTLTKTYRNEDKSIKVAQEIEKSLLGHNKLFKEKLDFGIGVNVGDLIVKTDKTVLKFASIGKTIPQAKKVADISKGEVLLSPDMHQKTMNNVKAEKVDDKAEAFKIKRIVDTNAANKFIQDFMRRN